MKNYYFKPTFRRRHSNVESNHQITVINHLRRAYPEALFNISPANTTNPFHGKQNKRMGLQKGCPDIMLFEPRSIYHALFIELKRPELRDYELNVYQTKGVLSKEQKNWIEKLNARGFKAVVCYGADEAIREIDSYMNRETKNFSKTLDKV